MRDSTATVTNWGSGDPRREFLFVDDLAAAILHLFDRYDDDAAINVGTGSDVSIRYVADLIATLIGFQGRTYWDTSQPDGTPRKLLDVSRLRGLGWSSQISLPEGLRTTIDWYRTATRTVA